MSGGPDSVALLLLAAAILPGQFAVATVDHGLRADSAAEAAMVAALCAERGIDHATLSIRMDHGAGVQERARIARYAALDAWRAAGGMAALVTAHHADDQAETLVMRLNRGAGLKGLAGMRAQAGVPGGDAPLLRPLLGWRRADLAAVVAAAGIVACDDPSNRDDRFERVRVRHGLAGASWIDPDGFTASARHLAEADAALDWAADGIALVGDGKAFLLPGPLPRALALRVLERVIVRLTGQPPARGGELARWHDRLAAGEVATLAGVRGDGGRHPWHFTRTRPHRRPG